MKNNGIFAVLQKIGRAFMLPIAVLPMAGILLGVGGSFTNPILIKTYNLTFLEPGTPLNYLMQLFSNTGLFVFANLPLLFGYALSARRTRINTACKIMLLDYVFDTLNCRCACWQTDNLNTASQRSRCSIQMVWRS